MQVYGGHNPIEMARTWTRDDVLSCYYSIRMKELRSPPGGDA